MSRKPIILAIVLLAGTLIASNGQAQGNRNSPSASSEAELTNNDILGMAKAGLPADVIIAKIQASTCAFDTSPAALEKLKAAGVPDSVILKMVNSPKTQPTKATEKPKPNAVQPGRNLWIARFTGQSEATAAIASVQQTDLATLEQSNLFKEVSSFATDPKQPAGTWSLSAKEISYSGGNTAKRVLIGFGTGRAHFVMEYKLRDPRGTVVWTKKIKTEPTFWASGGGIGGIQNQGSATGQQAQKLVDEISKFFASQS